MQKLLLMVVAVFLVGCVATPTIEIIQRPPFPVEEYQKLNKLGEGTVSGQVFLKTRGGDVKYGAGNLVWLNPKTSYSDFWHKWTSARINEGALVKLAPYDKRLEDYIIETQADGEGRFTFENVPDGLYYCTSNVHWEVPTANATMSTQGHHVTRLIEIKNGKDIKGVILNGFY